MKVLVAVDLQNDFINGALGTAEAAAMLPRAERKIRSFEGLVLFTRDTHTEDYLNTREGKALPVPHCIRGSHGWQLAARLLPYASEVIDKPTFGSTALGERLRALNEDAPIESITLIGLCTDICVISNALLLRAYLPEIPIIVDAACCAGVTRKATARRWPPCAPARSSLKTNRLYKLPPGAGALSLRGAALFSPCTIHQRRPPMKELILASSSPRRRELLSIITRRFTVQTSDCDEAIAPGTGPVDAVRSFPCAKPGPYGHSSPINGTSPSLAAIPSSISMVRSWASPTATGRPPP